MKTHFRNSHDGSSRKHSQVHKSEKDYKRWKERQKQLLIEMMKADERDGLYEEE